MKDATYDTIHPYHIANIIATFRSTSPVSRMAGYDWYPVTSTYVVGEGMEQGYTDLQSCALFATISPQRSIDENWRIYRDYIHGNQPWELTGSQLNKCNQIRDNADNASVDYWLRGPKVRPFCQNLMGDYSVVTADRHAVSNVLGKPVSKVATPKQLAYTRKVFTACAELIGIPVAMLQAICWKQWRAEYGLMKDSDVNFNAQWIVGNVAHYPSVLFLK